MPSAFAVSTVLHEEDGFRCGFIRASRPVVVTNTTVSQSARAVQNRDTKGRKTISTGRFWDALMLPKVEGIGIQDYASYNNTISVL